MILRKLFSVSRRAAAAHRRTISPLCQCVTRRVRRRTPEVGLDFERRVFEILQTCRTPEEIDAAFVQLQLELEGVITERRAQGRSLLQGLDDRIRDHLQVAEAKAREPLDRRTSLLRDFVLGSLAAHGANVTEEEPGLY